MSTNKRKFFISIDPGCVNNATLVMEVSGETFVVIIQKIEPMIPDTISNLDVYQRVLASLTDSVQQIHQLLEEGQQADITLLIEHQYIKPNISTLMLNIKLSIIENTLFTIAQERHLPVFLVNSSTYKRSLGISKGDHAKNKKAALQFAKEHDFVTKNDHFADCWNQAYWYQRNF